MKRTILLMMVALAGCDTAMDVEVHNDFAESLFTLKYELLDEDGEVLDSGTAMEDQRIGDGMSYTARNAFEAPLNDETFRLTLSAVSLGERVIFAPITPERDGTGYTYHVRYSFDTATGGFAISHGWLPR